MSTNKSSDPFIPGANDSEILRDTLRVYGSVCLACFVSYCIVRRTFRKKYNIRTGDRFTCDIAKECYEFGWIDWIWKVLRYTDDEIREQCGLDAVCLLRMFTFGMKLCAVGIFNSLWLIPIYATVDDDHWADHLEKTNSTQEQLARPMDHVARASVSALPPQSLRLIAPVVASYIVFGFTMYLILEEFAWFRKHRYAYLSEKTARNYSVYVYGIPRNLRDNEKLADFFCGIFSNSVVMGAEVYRAIPRLTRKVAERAALVRKLEHQIELNRIRTKRPSREVHPTEENVFAEEIAELADLNSEIPMLIDKIHGMQRNDGQGKDKGERKLNVAKISDDIVQRIILSEGTPLQGGFVYFTKRTARQATLRMLHSSTPYALDIAEAPDPENTFVRNIGKNHRQRNFGRLISFSLTFTLRLVWTIPTAFISSIANLKALGDDVPAVATLVEKYPWIVHAGSTLAPLLLLSFNSCLPILLEWISLFELPISQSELIATQFPKLASFMIIQTFFVSAISGSVWDEISEMTKSTSRIIDFLGAAFPGQSTYFIQILLVKTFIGLPIEMLKVMPLLKAGLRSIVGPNLTKKESERIYLKVIRPLNQPLWLLHAEITAANVLYFMVFFVYSSTAPLVNWILLFCFALLLPCWRYQIFCNYPTKPDTGGALYLTFMKIVRASAIIGQLALWAVLGLKRYPYAIGWMLPLLIVNVLFNLYVGQRQEDSTSALPSEECVAIDRVLEEEGEDFSFLKDAYKQSPLLASQVLVPYNWSQQHADLHEFLLSSEGSARDVEGAGDSCGQLSNE